MCYSLGTLHSTTSFAHRYFKYYTFSAGLAAKITKNLAVHIALLMYLQNIMSFMSFTAHFGWQLCQSKMKLWKT